MPVVAGELSAVKSEAEEEVSRAERKAVAAEAKATAAKQEAEETIAHTRKMCESEKEVALSDTALNRLYETRFDVY